MIKHLPFKEMTIVSAICFVLLGAWNLYYENTLAFHLPRHSFENKEQVQQNLEIRQEKMELMQRSYATMMDRGFDLVAQDSLYRATKRFFDAKSIFPYRLEPRLELCKTYVELARRHDFFLPTAQKEVHFAFKYIHNADDDILHEQLCQLDLALVDIWDNAQDRFKYWDELVQLEEY